MKKKTMKKKIVTISALTAVVLSLLAAGCSSQLTAEKVLKASAKALAKEKAISADWDLDMAASMKLGEFDGVDLDLILSANAVTEKDIENQLTRTQGNLSMKYFGTDQDMDLTVFTEKTDDDKLGIYMNTQDQWKRMSLKTEDEPADFSQLADKFTLAAETETVADTVCYKLTGRVSGAELRGQIRQLGLIKALTGGADSLDELDKSSFDICYYVAKEGSRPVRIQASIADGEQAAETETAETGAADTEALETGAAETGAAETGAAGTEAAGTEAAETEAAEPEAAENEAEPSDFALTDFLLTADYSYPESAQITIPEEAGSGEKVDSLLGDELDIKTGGSQLDSISGANILVDYTQSEDGISILYDKDGVRMSVERIYTDDQDNAYVDVQVTNSSAADLEVYSTGLALNDIMMISSLYLSVSSGDSMENCIKISDLGSYGLNPDKLGKLSLDLQASDNITYDTVLDTGVVSLTLQEGVKQESREGGSEIYSDDNLLVSAWPEKDDNVSSCVPLAIVNKSKESVSLSTESVINDNRDIPAYIITDEVFPGATIYVDFAMDSSDVKLYGLSDLAGSSFDLIAYDSLDYSEKFKTKTIKLP